MKLMQAFDEARATLGVDADADADAIRKAWRKAALKCPPDQDPEGFRRMRDAYELLSDPIPQADKMLQRAVPLVDAPPLPDHGSDQAPDSLPLALLRAVIGALPASAFPATPPRARRAAKTREEA